MSAAPRRRKNRKRHLFGTDGIRGVANLEPMTSEMALKLGRAMACVLHDSPSQTRGSARKRASSQDLLFSVAGLNLRRGGVLLARLSLLSLTN